MPAETTAQFGTFGTTRGSGLARGKRATAAAPATTTPESSGYQPTAIEIITPEREYHNPFASEQPAPAVAAPVKSEPAAPAAVVPVKTPAPAPVVVKPEPAPIAKAAAPAPAVTDETKAELKILPPAETKHAAQSWESASATPAKSEAPTRPVRHEERPTFRPERSERREQTGEPRSFTPRENREPREPRDSREPRAPRPASVPAVPAAKSGGFIGWLKSLFAGKPEAPAAAPETNGGSQRDDRPHHDHRRHRGGRGRNRNFNGPRDGQFRGNGDGQGPRRHDDQSSGGEGGQRRRRRRGGRNRQRGDHGGRNRPEGQQGGGAI
jgi:translation initiation factor IF-2